MDVFLEKVWRGGGVIFDPKDFIADFFLYILVVNFGKNVQKGGKRGGHHLELKKKSLQIYAI